jgi:hypothetical protein
VDTTRMVGMATVAEGVSTQRVNKPGVDMADMAEVVNNPGLDMAEVVNNPGLDMGRVVNNPENPNPLNSTDPYGSTRKSTCSRPMCVLFVLGMQPGAVGEANNATCLTNPSTFGTPP